MDSKDVSGRGWGRLMNPSREHLLGEYIARKHSVACHDAACAGDSVKKQILESCKEKLADIDRFLFPPPFGHKKSFAAWHLIHRIDEALIQVMSETELAAEGRKLLSEFKASSLPEAIKTDWITRLDASLKKLDGNPAKGIVDIREISQTIKTALGIYNDFTDDRFWEVWSRKFLSLGYLVLLVMIYAISSHDLSAIVRSSLTPPMAVLFLGSVGGVISGLITADQGQIAKGHFWVPSLYYLAAPQSSERWLQCLCSGCSRADICRS